MKKIVYSIVLFIILGSLLFLDGFYLIKPGINKYNEANKIVLLSDEELTSKREEIITKYSSLENDLNTKYVNLYKQLDDKYIGLNNDLEKEYSDKEVAINKKYDDMKAEIEAKYHKKMGEDGWYEEQVQMMNEESALSTPKTNEIMALISEKHVKENSLGSQKLDEKSALDDQKTNEEQLLNNKKNNELKNITSNKSLKKELKIAAYIYLFTGILLIVILIILNIKMFNKLIRLKNDVKKSWSSVEVLLKQRYDMIPNIVSVVKQYSKHEKTTLENIVKLRDSISQNDSKSNVIKANYKLNQDIQKILLLKEAYPELKSNDNFMKLQDELLDVENNIAEARLNYNNSVLKYQNVRLSIPTNLWAVIFNFNEEPYFGIKDTEKENVKVTF
jgi:LemA protein